MPSSKIACTAAVRVCVLLLRLGPAETLGWSAGAVAETAGGAVRPRLRRANGALVAFFGSFAFSFFAELLLEALGFAGLGFGLSLKKSPE